jgi:hypothetical protein
MHRRRIMYTGGHTHYPYRHCGGNFYSSYRIPAPLPIADVDIYTPLHYYDCRYRRDFSYIDYPYYNYTPRILPRPVVLPPIVHTTVQNDIYYCFDNPNIGYDDQYIMTDRPSRSKVQVVDLVPKTNRSAKRPPEQILIPRATLVRHTSLPPYERVKPMRLMPLYHSADPQYFMSSRRSVARKIVPLATIHTSR